MAITEHRTRSMSAATTSSSAGTFRDAVVKMTAYVSTLPAAPTVSPLHPVDGVRR